VLDAFVSEQGSGLHVITADIAFNLLSFPFIVCWFIIISHSAFVSWGANSCGDRLGCADHGFGFVWVGF
jgi:hypothetical protein